MIRVSDIMIKDTVCCTPLTKIEESRDMMVKYHCTKLPVVNTLKERRIIGAVSEKDIADEVGTIIHFMSRNLNAVCEDETVDECLRIMILNNVEQVPVIDKQGHFCGIVTQDEILR
ncbi:MAG: CBS domain-containing protein [Bacteriovorax sp.]|nr:CBS domain-containing protein [Bacteriovorax sp.]